MSDTLKLWFFRDLTDDQRLKLFGLFGLPVDEIGSVHGMQTKALRHIMQKLVEMVRDEAGQPPSSDVAVLEEASVRAFERAQEIKRSGGEIRVGYSWETLSEETKSCWRSVTKAAVEPLLNDENLRELRKNLREVSASKPTVYVSRKSLDELLGTAGSHVALQTLIHRKPLRSGNGVPLYEHPPFHREEP